MNNILKMTLLASTLAISSLSTTAQAELSLGDILTSIDNTGSWSEITSAALLSSSWNTAGSTLDFTLSAEESSLAFFQSFSAQGNTIFGGLSGVGATSSYQLTSSLSGANAFEFKTNFPFVTEFNVYSIWFNATSNTYALAFEDSPNFPAPTDYNDMVVSFSVTAVPEADTYAMFGLGLGMLALMTRRRRND